MSPCRPGIILLLRPGTAYVNALGHFFFEPSRKMARGIHPAHVPPLEGSREVGLHLAHVTSLEGPWEIVRNMPASPLIDVPHVIR